MASKVASREDQLAAKNKELQHEVSELGRLYELRGRELNAALKRANQVDALSADLDARSDDLEAALRELQAAQNALADAERQVASADAKLEDLAAARRLLGG